MPFEIETQLQDQWCWAAVSASVEKYYAGPNDWTNAALRVMFWVRTAAAIQAHAIRRRTYKTPLQLIERLRGIRLRSLTFDEVCAELTAGNPVGVRMRGKAAEPFRGDSGVSQSRRLSTAQYRRPMVRGLNPGFR